MDYLIHGGGKESSMTERLPWSLSLGGTEDKNLLASFCRVQRFHPCSGKILHAMGQQSPWATTTEAH